MKFTQAFKPVCIKLESEEKLTFAKKKKSPECASIV